MYFPLGMFLSLILISIYATVIQSTTTDSVYNNNGQLFPSLPETKSFNVSLAKRMSQLTAISYCQPEHIESWQCTPCSFIQPPLIVQKVFMDTVKDLFQGYVAYDPQYHSILIAFRGTRDVKNWLDNLTFIKMRLFPKEFPDLNIEVHSGFHKVYKSVSLQIKLAVSQLYTKYPTAKLHIVGHSLGAAVASLCSIDLIISYQIKVDSVYTFGEPRVGNKEYASLIKSNVVEYWRMTHWRDVVPHVPLEWMGFYHSGNEVFFNEYFSQYIVCDKDNGEDPTCSNMCSPFRCTSIEDHMVYLNITIGHLFC